MKLDLYDVDKMVELNKLPLVSTTSVLDKDGQPSRGGIYSYEIFGRPGSIERRFQFAYIDLHEKFFDPAVYKALIELDRKIPSIISGDRYVRLNKQGGYEESNEEEGDTGLNFFYKNWDKLKLDGRGTQSREDKINFLKMLKKNEVFKSKWPVIPPFFRDIDLSTSTKGVVSKDELSTMYLTVIALTNSLRDHSDIYTANITKSKVQEKLLEIYSFLTGKLAKKKGIIRQAIMGKSVDYAVRAVISGPEVVSPNYKEQQIPYGYIGIPLHMVMSAFLPFVTMQLENFFSSFTKGSTVSFSSSNKTYNIDDATIESLNKDKMIKLIKLYAISHEDRLKSFVIKNESGESSSLKMYEDKLGRPFNLTDLFFLVTSEVIKDKHVLATRYPIEDFRNVAIQKVKILTTERNTKIELLSGEKVFNNYPLINPERRVKWIDSVRPNNSYLSAWGGDFDGDMISIKGIFTQEANEEAARLIKSSSTLLNASGEPSRDIGKEGILTLYMMTK